ncbi:hypothetical protein FraQA3DRAFT_5453 [Frankia sp. QA3]|nr:hypothetical protein FraQA3DRAFT_5453 [Frankia sp. QA3]
MLAAMLDPDAHLIAGWERILRVAATAWVRSGRDRHGPRIRPRTGPGSAEHHDRRGWDRSLHAGPGSAEHDDRWGWGWGWGLGWDAWRGSALATLMPG